MAVERFSPLSVQEMRLPSVAAGKLCPPCGLSLLGGAGTTVTDKRVENMASDGYNPS